MKNKANIAFALTALVALALQPAALGWQLKLDNTFAKLDLNQPRYQEPWPLIALPIGCDKLLSRDCPVTSSDPDPIIGELSYITDGDKEHDAASYVELAPGLQWIQIDLGSEKEIHAICIWHYYGDFSSLYGSRIYRDVIVQISNDPDFEEGVATVFNNDHDNSAKLGKGKDFSYFETPFGRPFTVDAVKGRYVRCYSRGSTSNEMNHYTEVEIFGRHLQPEKQR